uniref:Uncharacterized protein n=1 Tax=Rhizophora mucronata TaxID=61149 RepID=A0A2P2IT01_RHIMU
MTKSRVGRHGRSD